ncbi:MAG: ABC transporter permease [Devosia sp.]|nr:ABC transporter permease [Devosia sp.]
MIAWFKRLKEGFNPGLFLIALKLLVNDRSKFYALVIGITFAVFLMVQMTAMFAGVLQRSSSTVANVGASIWVMDPAVQTVSNSIPLPDYVQDAVRSMNGVKYAVPLYSGGGLVKLSDGTYQSVSVIGLDDTSLYGRPALEKGNIEDIYAENGFIVVHDAEFGKLGSPAIGSEFQLNDHRAVIVGIAKVASNSLFGVPTLYTTYDRALQYLPQTRFTTAYVLVEPKTKSDVPRIEAAVAKLGYLALTKKQFDDRIAKFYTFQTGIGMNIMLMTVISFIVGLSISGQTFYTFVLENIDKFGALKAIGAQGRELVYMILFQAAFTGLIGYGLGVGLCALVIEGARLRMPDYAAVITFPILLLAFAMTLVITGISSFIAARRVLSIDPFEIFRG